ncbi:MAG: glycoside hydrolase family 15 protein [Actinobacteria bacterium]|nr:glycoside hydrolase family 15 protein [Actinomycetota bacterium]
MANRIEDYAFLSDTQSAALVGRDGSIDWLTFPRFDSPACFAALLGSPDNGRWSLAPAGPVRAVSRRYRPGTLVLETRFTTDDGEVEVVDCMPVRGDGRLDVVRLARGISGRVPMAMQLAARMDYGSLVPWVRRVDGGLHLVAGPDSLCLNTSVELRPEGWSTAAHFTLGAGDEVGFDLVWSPSHLAAPPARPVRDVIDETTAWWQEWTGRCGSFGPYDEAISSSLTVLKGLTYAPTGGIVAAPTTSLPEAIGNSRNWDYRYCWLRDATFTLTSLRDAGYHEEARAWWDWLLRAVAGRPDDVQIMYGPAGEHRLTEEELPWLAGFEGSRPVRIGNAAHGQFQLDVYGEVLDSLFEGHRDLVQDATDAWAVAEVLTETVVERWREPDDGIWEVRGGRRHFTHSKVMAWVALDRAVRLSELLGVDAPTERWRSVAAEVRAEVLAHGVDHRGAFVQELDGSALDASLLLVPLVGFLPADDPRVTATVEAVQRELTHDGLVHRYDPAVTDDGVGGTEGTFLLCTFWLADVLVMQGRVEEATEVYERLLGLRNDVGLLAEMYDPGAGRMLGNFPQAFSHTALVSTGIALSRARSGAPAEQVWRRT